jgi:hypothetical protein
VSTPEQEHGLVAELRRENDQLRQALDGRAVIEQAKGALILRYGLSEDAAFHVLRRWSQISNIKVSVIADTLVNVVCRDDPRSTPDDVELVGWLQQQVRDPVRSTAP